MKFDSDTPNVLFVSWGRPFRVADAKGENGANVVWRSDHVACWYDQRVAGSKLIVRLTKSEPPGVCLEDSVFETDRPIAPVQPPPETPGGVRQPPDRSAATPKCGLFAIAFCFELFQFITSRH